MTPPRARLAALVSLLIALFPGTFPLAAQSLPELFQKAKAQVRGESWSDALSTLERLESDAARPGNESARSQLAAPIAFYRGVCTANLGREEEARSAFATFLALEPNAAMDASAYSKKAVAAFQAARKSSATAPGSSYDEKRPAMFVAFQEFKLPPNSGEPVGAAWADGPIKWIMTPDEKRAWSSLAFGDEQQEFVEKFWEARNPQPGNPDNSYKNAFERRVAFADSRFSEAEGSRGSMTDRGRVFVLLGPPTYVGRRPIRPGDDTADPSGGRRAFDARIDGAIVVNAFQPARGTVSEAANNMREVWHYRKELLPKGVGYNQVDFDFITKKGYGVNVMQRDPVAMATLDVARTPSPPEQK